MTLPLRWLTPKLAVAPQLGPEHMALAAQEGFKSVICNRPDGEAGPDQPSQDAVGEAARAAGLEFAYLPVGSSNHTPEQADGMGELMAKLPTPILAYCRSGNRCIGLIGLSNQQGHAVPQ